MSKIIDQTESKLANAEFKVASAAAKIASTQADVASTQKTIVENMSKQKSNKNLFVIVFVALVINLVLTVSLAGAFVTLNENAAKADEVAAVQALTEQTAAQTELNTAVIESAQAIMQETDAVTPAN